MPNERELWILIKAKDLSEKALSSVRKGLEKLEKITKRIRQAMWTAFKKIGEGFKKAGSLLLKAFIWPFKMAIKLVEKFGAGIVWLGLFAFRKLFVAMGGSWKRLALLIVGVIVGIKSIKKLRQEVEKAAKVFEDLSNLAIQVGRSIEDLAERLYHLEIPKRVLESIRKYEKRLDAMRRASERTYLQIYAWWANLSNWIADRVENIIRTIDEWLRKGFPVPLGPIDWVMNKLIELFDTWHEKTKETYPLEEKLSNEIKKLTLSRVEYQRVQYEKNYENYKRMLKKEGADTRLAEDYKRAYINKMADEELKLFQELYAEKARLEGRFTDAFRAELEVQRIIAEKMWGEKGWMVEMYMKNVEIRQYLEKLHTYGLKAATESWTGMISSFASSTETLLSDLFVTAWQGKLKSAKEIFYRFITSLQRAIANFLAQRLTQMLFGRIMGITAPAGTIIGGRGVTVPITTGYAMAQAGGEVVRTGAAIIHRGEEIIPAERRVGDIHNYYYIQAVDASSFARLVARNPEAIKVQVDRAIRLNQPLRRAIKDLTR